MTLAQERSRLEMSMDLEGLARLEIRVRGPEVCPTATRLFVRPCSLPSRLSTYQDQENQGETKGGP